MALEIPDLQAARCLLLIACGELVGDDKKLKRLKTAKKMVAHSGIADKRCVVRAMVGEPPAGHFHIDVAAKAFFREDPLPKKTHKMSDISSLVEGFAGEKVNLDTEAFFLVDQKELPTLIQKTLIESPASDGVSVRMTAGTLVVKGAPLYRIRWQLADKNKAAVRMEFSSAGVLGDNYLLTAMALAESAFKSFIIGKSLNVASTTKAR